MGVKCASFWGQALSHPSLSTFISQPALQCTPGSGVGSCVSSGERFVQGHAWLTDILRLSTFRWDPPSEQASGKRQLSSNFLVRWGGHLKVEVPCVCPWTSHLRSAARTSNTKGDPRTGSSQACASCKTKCTQPIWTTCSQPIF